MKETMKKYLYIALGLVAAATFTSCDDEGFLTEQPKTIFTVENAFEKASQVDAALAKAYIAFDALGGYSNPYAGGDGVANFLHGDGSDVLSGTQGKMAASGFFSNYWALNSTNSNFNRTWTALYQLASYANLASYGATQVEGADPALAAQADFFVGFAYLRLAECFGGVPIVEEFNQELKFDYVRETREATYDFAIKKFSSAAQNLPAVAPQDGRLSQGVAYHYLAEAYLGQHAETGNATNLDSAIAAAQKVIAAHPLMTERFGSRSANGTQPAGIDANGVERYREDGNVFYDLFQIGNFDPSAGNTEALYVRQTPKYEQYAVSGGSLIPFGITICPPFRDLTWNAEYSASQGGSGGPWKGNVDTNKYPGGTSNYKLGGTSWGIIGSTDYTDEDVWEGDLADDIRNSQVVLWDPEVMDSKTPMYGQKIDPQMLVDPARYTRVSIKTHTDDLWGWNLGHHVAFGSSQYVWQYGRDWYIARSSETYLLLAEAYLKKGDAAKAAETINVVRKRAQCSKLFTADEVDIYTILDERARELIWEEFRWPTLLRMGGQGKNDVMKKQLLKYSYGMNDCQIFADRTSFPEWTLFAIPYDVIALNSGAEMAQNPGWDGAK